jgi:hypothetical protein
LAVGPVGQRPGITERRARGIESGHHGVGDLAVIIARVNSSGCRSSLQKYT